MSTFRIYSARRSTSTSIYSRNTGGTRCKGVLFRSMTAANLTSIAALREFKGALGQFEMSARDALVQLTLESRRALEWLEADRAHYWPREVRKASDSVNEARLAYDRCRVTVAGEERACYDERKALEAAKRRLALSESKVVAVRRWRNELVKELEAFDVERAKLERYLDFDLAKAIAALERLAQAIDQYVEQTALVHQPPEEPKSCSSAT